MLKQDDGTALWPEKHPAAFRRLCVETRTVSMTTKSTVPAAFRRLWVETYDGSTECNAWGPAAFRRLCVETSTSHQALSGKSAPAAFRRLCVETLPQRHLINVFRTSRLQAAVC